MEVVEFHVVDGAQPEPLLALAVGAETAIDDHPVARGIARLARDRGVEAAPVRRASYIPGRGVVALAPNGESIVVGSRPLLLDEGVGVAVADQDAQHAEMRGYTAVFIGVGGRVKAVLALSDTIRPGARAAVQRLFDLDLEVVLLSGDHRPTVETLAKNLDVVNVRAELVPEERGIEVQRLRDTGGTVACVGRPKYDDAALAAADVSLLLDAAGTSHGDRSIALASNDIRDAASGLWIAHAARAEVVRALAVSTIGGGLLVVAAVMSLAGPAIAVLLAAALETFALPAGGRLLRRIALRVPTRE
jgi:Cu+-exporting ATPase